MCLNRKIMSSFTLYRMPNYSHFKGIFCALNELAKIHTFSALKALKNKGFGGKLGDCKGQNFFKFLQVF